MEGNLHKSLKIDLSEQLCYKYHNFLLVQAKDAPAPPLKASQR
jgi:hypothetical protein